MFRRRGRGQRQQSKAKTEPLAHKEMATISWARRRSDPRRTGRRTLGAAKWGARTARFADGSLTCNCRDYQWRSVEKIFAAKKMLAYAENSAESAGHGDTRDDPLRPSGLLGNTWPLRGRRAKGEAVRSAQTTDFATGGLSPKENTAQAMLGTAAIMPAIDSPPIAAARSFTF